MPPLLRPVEESQLRALQQRLTTISKLSRDFLMLLSSSTVIATLGLFQNSPAVIIGAMIIAPLMRPLVGLSLATLTGDGRLLARALLTLGVGTVTGIVISSALALLFQSLELTPEILGRTHPTLLDLGVAVFAGAIGAYCQADEKLSDSLAGVAIAVALVPPLSVVGIGLALGNWSVWSGAALLYATNLIGITIAGALMFLLLGFTPLHQAKKGLLVSAGVSLLLIVPLGFSMRELILENQISANIKQTLEEKTFTFKGAQLLRVRVEGFKKPIRVVATVLSPDQPISQRQVSLVQEFLVKELNIPLEFSLQIIPATRISGSTISAPSTSGIPPERTVTERRPSASEAGPIHPKQSDVESPPTEKSIENEPEQKLYNENAGTSQPAPNSTNTFETPRSEPQPEVEGLKNEGGPQ